MPDSSPARAPATRGRGQGAHGAPRAAGGLVPMLLRFISCGLLSLAGGVAWRVALAPRHQTPMSAVAGLAFLLGGFIIGGLLWYLRDLRARSRDAARVSEERLFFSFVVFAVVPFAVLLLVAAVWMVAFVVGMG